MGKGKIKTPPPTPDGMWQVVREMKRFTVKDIVRKTGADKNAAYYFVAPLRTAGYIKKIALQGGSDLFELVKDCGVMRPLLDRKGEKRAASVYDRMWLALKVLKFFDARDLSLAASCTTKAAEKYCHELYAAGYLLALDAARFDLNMRPLISYRFVTAMDTGPRGPVVMRYLDDRKRLFDRNLGRFTGPEEQRGAE